MTQPPTQVQKNETVEITERYSLDGYLLERYYLNENGEVVHLPIPKFIRGKKFVTFINPEQWEQSQKEEK